MTKFISTVRFTVKDDCVDEFIKREKELDFTGMASRYSYQNRNTRFVGLGFLSRGYHNRLPSQMINN